MIQGLIILNNPDYEAKRYHGTLIAMTITVAVSLFNIFLARHLPLVEGCILILHFAGFFAIVVSLWVLAPRTPHALVWNNFQDGGGWGSIGLACLVGMLTNVGAFVGSDAAAHMSEELRNASKVLPRAMLTTVISNGCLGFVMLVTLLYTIGDLESVLGTATGYPIIQVFYNATLSNGGATGLTCILVVLNIANNLTNTAGASRQLFAFARDRGVPGNSFIGKVPAGWDVPVNSVITTAIFACCLHCINIGSAIAFNVIISIGTVALGSSYLVCIGCITYRRIACLGLLDSRFSLGKFGLPINVIALLANLMFLIFAFFPPIKNPGTASMNWAIAVYGGVLTLALVYYFVKGRRDYAGPVEYVRKSA